MSNQTPSPGPREHELLTRNSSQTLKGPNNYRDENGYDEEKGDNDFGRIATEATGKSLNLSRSISRRETALSRIRSRPVPVFSHPLAHIPTGVDVLVDFDGSDDPYRPMNWPMHKKASTVLLYALVTMSATWASSSYSSGTHLVAEEFHVGSEVAILGTTLFLIGFGIGPLLWAPLSEIYGRRLAVLIPMFPSMCFSFASAVSKDFQSLMITRFFAGFFGAAPVANTGGVLGDLFSPSQRGFAMSAYAMVLVFGPIIGPIVSSAIAVQPELGWRWTEYLTGILQAVVLLAAIIFVDETYAPVLLVHKAQRLRRETGNWALHAKFEEWDISAKEMATKFLLRPIQLLSTPICFLVATYASFCYGILYMQLGAIPIIFHRNRHWPIFTAELPFLAILVGVVIAAGINCASQHHYNKAYRAAGNRAVPEMRLPPMMFGGILFAAGLFMTGWTADPSIHWIAPVIALAIFGCGFFTLFQAALNYLIDTFTMYAASAVAANTFLRSCFAAGFPLAVGPLFRNIGVGPGSSIIGGFACLLIPVPFVFFVYGKEIRRRSKWSRPSVHDH